MLPEFFPTGNTLEPELLKVAIKSSNKIVLWLLDTAKKYQMIIAGGYLSLEGKDVYNKFVFQEPNGNSYFHFKAFSPAVESVTYRTFEKKGC